MGSPCQAAFAALQHAEFREGYAQLVLGADPKSVDPEVLRRLQSAGLLSMKNGQLVVNPEFFAQSLHLDQQSKPQGPTRYLRLEKLEMMPTNLRDRREVLSLICSRLFEPGKHYPEREINSLLRVVSDDVSGLRRALVDGGLLARIPDGSSYWLADSELGATP